MPPAMIKVKPGRGADGKTTMLVRNPNRKMRPLAAGGEFVPHSSYWQRRLIAGDVVPVVDEPANEKAAALPPPAEPPAEPK